MIPEREGFHLPGHPAVFRRGFAFLDLETTGTNPAVNDIIEVGIIRDGAPWSTKVAVGEWELKRASPEALKVNGYSAEAWADAPAWDVVAEQVARQLHGAVIVAHNATFDLEFLDAAFEKAGISPRSVFTRGGIIDTYPLAKGMLTPLGLKKFSLDACCEFLGIEREGVHRALGGAERCRSLFLKMRELMEMGWKHGQSEKDAA